MDEKDLITQQAVECKLVQTPAQLKQKDNKLGNLMYWTRYEDQRCSKIGEIRDLVPRFKDYYYSKKLETQGKYSAMKIIMEFQDIVAPLKFSPSPHQFRRWRMKWDKEIAEKMNYDDQQVIAKREMRNAIKMRNEEGALVIPDEPTLEDGSKLLAGALVNDAMKMLSDDQELDEIYTSDEVVKRRNYVLNVMAHVTKLVHGKKALDIKSNAEKREAAGFLMDLIRRASAGKMTEEEFLLLKDSIKPAPLPAEIKTEQPIAA